MFTGHWRWCIATISCWAMPLLNNATIREIYVQIDGYCHDTKDFNKQHSLWCTYTLFDLFLLDRIFSGFAFCILSKNCFFMQKHNKKSEKCFHGFTGWWKWSNQILFMLHFTKPYDNPINQTAENITMMCNILIYLREHFGCKGFFFLWRIFSVRSEKRHSNYMFSIFKIKKTSNLLRLRMYITTKSKRIFFITHSCL